jgi:hypothetical protein
MTLVPPTVHVPVASDDGRTDGFRTEAGREAVPAATSSPRLANGHSVILIGRTTAADCTGAALGELGNDEALEVVRVVGQ